MNIRCPCRGAESWSDLSSAAGADWTGEARGDSQPVQAPRLSHWSKYGTAGSAEPVRGDPSARGRRRNRDSSFSEREPLASDQSRADDSNDAVLPLADVTGMTAAPHRVTAGISGCHSM